MVTLVASEARHFDKAKHTFGTKNETILLGTLKKLETDLNELRTEREKDKLRLDQLEPSRLQISAIRKPVLVKLAHLANTNWPLDPPAVQERNVFAHGGQARTDIAIIQCESDPAQKKLLSKGFDLGYGLPLSLQTDFLKYKAVINLMNISCNLKTLDTMVGKKKDREETKKLLEQWRAWVRTGGNLDTYPFTTTKESIVIYNRLIKRYRQTIPRE